MSRIRRTHPSDKIGRRHHRISGIRKSQKARRRLGGADFRCAEIAEATMPMEGRGFPVSGNTGAELFLPPAAMPFTNMQNDMDRFPVCGNRASRETDGPGCQLLKGNRTEGSGQGRGVSKPGETIKQTATGRPGRSAPRHSPQTSRALNSATTGAPPSRRRYPASLA